VRIKLGDQGVGINFKMTISKNNIKTTELLPCNSQYKIKDNNNKCNFY